MLFCIPRPNSTFERAFRKKIDHIWISDELLTGAFNRFCALRKASGKRHGSNVPGPLEAQRRLARRRMNNISVGREVGREVGLNLPPPAPPPQPNSEGLFDRLIGIFGAHLQQRAWTWEPPRPTPPIGEILKHVDAFISPTPHAPDMVQPQSGLKSPIASVWHPGQISGSDVTLEPYPSAEIPQSVLLDPHLAAPSKPVLRSLLSMDEYEMLLRQDKVINITRLRAFHTKMAGVLRDFKKCSEVDFDRIIMKKPPFELLCQFLSDESLNISRGRNIRRLVDYCATHAISPIQCSVLADYIQKEVQQQVIKPSYLIRILRLMRTVVRKAQCVDEDKFLLRVYRTIWKAACNYDASSIRTYRAAFFHAFLDRCAKLEPSFEAKAFIVDLLRADLPLYSSEFTKNTQKSLAICTRTLLLPSAETTKGTTRHDATLLGILNACSPTFAIPWIISSSTLFADQNFVTKIGVKRRSDILKPWLVTVQNCAHIDTAYWDQTWETIYHQLASKMEPKELAFHFAALPGRDICRILIQHWFPTPDKRAAPLALNGDMSTPLLAPLCSDGNGDMIALLKEVQRANNKKLQKIELRLLKALNRRSISAISLAIAILPNHHTQPRSFDKVVRLFTAMGGRHLIEELVDVLLRRFPRTLSAPVVASVIRKAIVAKLPSALRLFHLDKRVWLSQCPALIHSLIREEALKPRDVLDVLNRFDSRASTLPRRQQGRRQCTLSRQRILLVHSMANQISQSKMLCSKNAYRCIYTCYMYLRRNKSPIYPLMSQALTRAGLLRPLEEGKKAKPRVCKFVLGVIMRSEGVARMRQTSARIDHVRRRVRRRLRSDRVK